MTLALVSHLVRQGVYKRGEIAVLTPYMAQFRQLKQRLGSMFEVTLNERDQADLEAEEHSVTNSETAGIAGKAKLLESVRIATIDNFRAKKQKWLLFLWSAAMRSIKLGFLRLPTALMCFCHEPSMG